MAAGTQNTAMNAQLMTQSQRTTLIRCAACGNTLNDPVLLAGCLHSVCRKCLRDLPGVSASGGSSSDHAVPAGIACPQCSVVGAVAQPKSNYFLLMLLRALGISGGAGALCDFCPAETKASADRWCAECSSCICTQCAVWHTKFNKDHATRAVPATLGGGKEMAGGAVPCDMCAEAGKDVGSASCWCAECSKAMCARCTTWHDRFQKAHGTTSLQAGDAIINRSLLTAPACGQHDLQFEFFCKTCDSLKCADCSKPCLGSNHHTWVVDGSRAREHIEKTKADIKAAHELLQSRSGSWMLATTDADEERDMLDRVERALAADQDRLSCNRRRALDSLNKAFDEAEQQVQKHYETVRQRLVPEPRGTALTGQTLRNSLHHALLYCQVLLQAADAAVVLDQHAVVLAGLQMLADRTSKQPTVATVEELLQSAVRELDDTSVDASITNHIRALLKLGHGSQPSSAASPGPISSHAALPSQITGASSIPGGNSGQPVDNKVTDAPPSGSSCVEEAEDGAGIGLGDAAHTVSVQGNVRDVALLADGHILLADVEKGLRQYSVDGKKLTTWLAPKADQRSKAGVVSTVCTLDDGRIAVGVISNSCVMLLKRSTTAGDGSSDRWVADQEIRLSAGPYHVACHGDTLAVAIAHSDEKKLDLGVLSAVVGSQWGPGPRVDLVPIGDDVASTSEVVRSSLAIGYNAVAVLLTATAVVVSSDERQKMQSGRSCFVVDAFARDDGGSSSASRQMVAGAAGQRRLWRHECDEHVHDLCAATRSATVIYLVLPESRRVTAIDGASGQWLVDVLSSSQTLGKPLRISLLRCTSSGKASLAILYKDSAVTVHPVGGSCE